MVSFWLFWGVQGAQRISGFTLVSGGGAEGVVGAGAAAPGRKPEKPPPPSPPPQAERAEARTSAETRRTGRDESRMVGSLELSRAGTRMRKKMAREGIAHRTGTRLGRTRYIAMNAR